jgi:hypothetical protein
MGKSANRKFYGLSGNRKSANFYKVLHNSLSKAVLKVFLLNEFCVMYKFKLENYMLYL